MILISYISNNITDVYYYEFQYYFRINGTLSCFDNFVPSNAYGAPSFDPTHNALKHLKELIKSSLNQIKACNTGKVYMFNYIVYIKL